MRWLPFAVLALLVSGSSLAHADQIHYIGSHPLDRDGYCYIEVPHVHAYGPRGKQRVLYRKHKSHYHFVGDPVAHGFDGRGHRYYGHHPIATSSYVIDEAPDAELFCYIDGPHFHAVVPDPSLSFKVSGDAYWYTGPVPKGYAKARVEYAPMTRFYADIDYVRPEVHVEVPVGYAFAEVHVPVAHVDAEVVAPEVHILGPARAVAAEFRGGVGVSAGVEVHVPTVAVEIGGPAVVVEGGPPGHYKHKHYKKRGKKRYRNPGLGHRRDFRRRDYRDRD